MRTTDTVEPNSPGFPGKTNLYFVGRTFSHHSRHAGYDHISDFLPGRVLSNDLTGALAALSKPLIRFMVKKADIGAYNRDSAIAELKVMMGRHGSFGTVFHFLYGEAGYRYSGYWRNGRRGKMVVTLHQPPSVLSGILEGKNHLSRADAVVALGTRQYEFLNTVVSPAKVSLIPHGVDTDYYKPSEDHVRDGVTCLFVGKWLRDFKMLSQAIPMVVGTDDSIRFKIVTNPANGHFFRDLPNTEVLHRIPDSDLVKLYRTSMMMAIPIKDCTANNSILEGLSCGIPVVTTNVGDIQDYVDQDCAVLVPAGDSGVLAREIVALKNDPARRRRMSDRAQERARALSWTSIVNAYQELYRKLRTE